MTRPYDMQLRPEWPMGGMGGIPEMGNVVVNLDGFIQLQRVDLYVGDNSDDMSATMQSN